MRSKRFLLIHADKSRAHISTAERDSLLVAKAIRKVNDFTYEFIAQKQRFRSFVEWGSQFREAKPIGPVKRYLGIHCIFDLNGRRRTEHERTEDDIVIQLQTA